jgi:hypothetical protein
MLNYETVVHPEIDILTSNICGTVKNSPEMVRSVVAAAERAGVPYKLKPAFLGVGERRGSLQPGWPQGCDTASLPNAAAVGGFLPSKVGHPGSFNQRAFDECPEAHVRVGAQPWRVRIIEENM